MISACSGTGPRVADLHHTNCLRNLLPGQSKIDLRLGDLLREAGDVGRSLLLACGDLLLLSLDGVNPGFDEMTEDRKRHEQQQGGSQLDE